MSTAPRLIEVRAKVLKQNDLLARQLREQFRRSGVYVVSLVSSPGSGKTAFLEKLLSCLGVNQRRGRARLSPWLRLRPYRGDYRRRQCADIKARSHETRHGVCLGPRVDSSWPRLHCGPAGNQPA